MGSEKNLQGLKPVFIIGTSKAGTTSIAHSLDLHPNICLSDPKETNYFSWDDNYLGKKQYDSYFELKGGETHFVDASTHYSSGDVVKVANRIYKEFPDAKIIYIVRDPLDKYYSEAKQLLFMDGNNKPYGVLTSNYYKESYSFYKNVDTYEKLFGKDNFLLLQYEYFRGNQSEVLQQIMNFIGVEVKDIEVKQLNISSEKEKNPIKLLFYLKQFVLKLNLYHLTSEKHRHYLRKVFSKEPDIKKFEDELRAKERDFLLFIWDDLQEFLKLNRIDINFWKSTGKYLKENDFKL